MKKYLLCICLIFAAWDSMAHEDNGKEFSPYFQELQTAFENKKFQYLPDVLERGHNYIFKGKCFTRYDYIGNDTKISVKVLPDSCLGNAGAFFNNVETGCSKDYTEINGLTYVIPDTDEGSGYELFRVVEHNGHQYALRRIKWNGDSEFCHYLIAL